MNIIMAHNLACPIDGGSLESREKQLVCAKGHAFDVARQGYVNLLPVQHKRSKQPGDSKEMVAARTQFLNAGFYAPIATRLADSVYAHMGEDKDICILDAGCGEGYYLDTVCNFLNDKEGERNIAFIGLDISKYAVAEAARRNRHISWIVGTNRQPPVEVASVDMIVCVFGFQSFDGFNKILTPKAKVILVEPGPDHLKELREVIYTQVNKPDPSDPAQAGETGFSIVDSQPLKFTTHINSNAHIYNLLLMTPHYFRATSEGKEAVAKLQSLEVTVDVVFNIFEKAEK